MNDFIEVTDMENRRRFINLNWVLDIWDDGDSSTIYFAYNAPYANESEFIRVQERYDALKRKIWR